MQKKAPTYSGIFFYLSDQEEHLGEVFHVSASSHDPWESRLPESLQSMSNQDQ